MEGNKELKSAQTIIYEMANKYRIPYEIVEAIILEWVSLAYYALTFREPDKGLPLL